MENEFNAGILVGLVLGAIVGCVLGAWVQTGVMQGTYLSNPYKFSYEAIASRPDGVKGDAAKLIKEAAQVYLDGR